MDEPKRLSDEDDFGAQLLRGAKSYQASGSSRQQTLTALGLVGAPALVAAKTSTAAALGGKLWALIGAGVVSGGVLLAGTGAFQSEPPAPPEVQEPAAAQTASKVEAPALSSDEAVAATPLEALPIEEPRAAHESPKAPKPAVSRSTRKAPVKVPPNQDALSAELLLLDQARREVAGGQAGAALSTLSTHQRKFPRGRLALEAEALRIEALSKSGNRAAASKRARAFLKRHPKSLLAPRMERFAR